jgi:hypothetical protein
MSMDCLLPGTSSSWPPGRPTWVRAAIDEVRESIQNPDGYRKINGDVLYVHSRLYPWGESRKRCYLHIYYNAHAAATVADGFTEELRGCKEELEKGIVISGHKDAYKTFFIVKETTVRGRRVLFNNEVIEKNRNRYAGFYALLTNDIKDPLQALMVYRNKDTVEKCFDDLKNQLDIQSIQFYVEYLYDLVPVLILDGSAEANGPLLIRLQGPDDLSRLPVNGHAWHDGGLQAVHHLTAIRGGADQV